MSSDFVRLSASTFERTGDADGALLSCLLGRECGALDREDTAVRPWLTILDNQISLCDPRTLEPRQHDVRDWGMVGALNSGAIGRPVYASDGRSFTFCVCDDVVDLPLAPQIGSARGRGPQAGVNARAQSSACSARASSTISRNSLSLIAA